MTTLPETLDLAAFVRPGDTIVWGQACSEPRALTALLLAQSGRIGKVRCFVGIPAESELVIGSVTPEIEVHSYCGSGTNAKLYDAGLLEIWPLPYSTFPALLTTGDLRADVVFVQVSPPDAHGRCSLGLGDDYFSAAVDTARVVIAEVNDHVPYTFGAKTIALSDCAAAIHSARLPGTMPTPLVDDQSRAVARQVAGLIPDQATLQFGIGALPEAVLGELFDHRGLGIHSGIINDTAMRLIHAGVATGSHKTSDRGVAIGGLFGGTRELFTWAHRNPLVQLRPTSYTHDPAVLAGSHRLVAVNAAVEVDLTGQVNAEAIGERYVGAVGGAGDFLTGAHRSKGGVPIVALPSTARGRSRIVARLSGPVSTPRSQPIVVVTEHGVADLRSGSLSQRLERLLAIADPTHQHELEAEAGHALASA